MTPNDWRTDPAVMEARQEIAETIAVFVIDGGSKEGWDVCNNLWT